MDVIEAVGTVVSFITDVSIIINILYLIFLAYEFTIPNSPIKTPYFAMLMFGMIFIVMNTITSVLNSIWIEEYWSDFLFSICNWYALNELGIWNLCLGWNRCTALMSPTMHSKVCYLFFKEPQDTIQTTFSSGLVSLSQ